MIQRPSLVSKASQGAPSGIGVAPSRQGVSGHAGPDHRLFEYREHAIHHGDFQSLADPGPVPLSQGGEDADGQVQARQRVGDRRAGLQRRLPLEPGQGHQAAHGLGDGVHAGHLRVGSRASEAVDGPVDDLRIDLPGPLVADSQAIESARLEVLGDHIGPLDQTQEEPAPRLLLEIQSQRLLPPVQHVEVAAVAVRERRDQPRPIAEGRALHLDHLCAEVGEHHGGEGPGVDPGQVQHPDSIQRFRIHEGDLLCQVARRRRQSRKTHSHWHMTPSLGGSGWACRQVVSNLSFTALAMAE